MGVFFSLNGSGVVLIRAVFFLSMDPGRFYHGGKWECFFFNGSGVVLIVGAFYLSMDPGRSYPGSVFLSMDLESFLSGECFFSAHACFLMVSNLLRASIAKSLRRIGGLHFSVTNWSVNCQTII